MTAQLHMSQGILPWLRDSAAHLMTGAADAPLGADYQRFLAQMADAEYRLHVRLSHVALPEQLRQSVLSNAAAILAGVETSATRLTIDLEKKALSAAAACREQCGELEDLSPQQRQKLADQCESLLFELIRPTRGHLELADR